MIYCSRRLEDWSSAVFIVAVAAKIDRRSRPGWRGHPRGGGTAMRRILIALALTLIALPGWAETSDENWAKCVSPDPDTRISGCTALIQSGQLPVDPLQFGAPGVAEVYTNRGSAYYAQGLCDQAIADYTKAIALNADLALPYDGRGSAYKAKGLHDQAIADATKAIALEPDCADAYYNRGNAYSDKGLYDQAIADYTKAVALRPDHASAYNGRAWAFHEKREDAKGLPDAERAVRLAPRDAPTLETRAEIYERLGRRDEAIADYRAALKLNAKLKEALEGLKRLRLAP
jgi:tetratricopeptide (TPR) repeat protein